MIYKNDIAHTRPEIILEPVGRPERAEEPEEPKRSIFRYQTCARRAEVVRSSVVRGIQGGEGREGRVGRARY